ncbi:MAG: ROK family protein [Verrucomicrobiaceae bacterium]|nr:ROK family protein [Verrucomicrobiaceae bacterium]
MSLQDSNITAIGIDFGGTSVKIGVARGPEMLHSAEPIPTQAHPGPQALIGAMVERIDEIRAHFPEVAAVGCGVPGLVDFDRGFVHELTNVPGWKHIPLRTILHERTGLPCVIENDANAMTYAEWRYGAGKGLKNVIALTLGTGVGGGVVINQQLYRGSSFCAGEIGQMSVHFDGKPGHYGNLGALEKYVGNNQIAEHAVVRYAEAGVERSVEECRPKDIALAAQAGDDIARQIWAEVADWLGTALSSIAWLLNPDAFVIGGGVAQAGPLLFDPLERKVKSMLSTIVWEKLQILPARFSNEAGIIGNAALAADSI